MCGCLSKQSVTSGRNALMLFVSSIKVLWIELEKKPNCTLITHSNPKLSHLQLVSPKDGGWTCTCSDRANDSFSKIHGDLSQLSVYFSPRPADGPSSFVQPLSSGPNISFILPNTVLNRTGGRGPSVRGSGRWRVRSGRSS